ncbi:MAG: hypothetical protein REI64_01180 [Pedobacter sp.]|uniref:hypothetical protein n=1 Tax=Pedobacter sp. TaxID=1411316 RepID=UPI00280878D8|nr:hypothetical protein [Pedobacter sp.]MDQ8003377.1 hypothetical protein [Pedobacter sp.]
MFLPLFIAILLGLASPAQQTCGNGNTTVHVNNTDPEGTPGDPENGGEDGDGGGHNGDNGTIRPTKP